VQVREALRLDPDRLSRLIPFVWLLEAHPVATSRRPDDARQLAERIVAVTGRRDPAALDALAACYAALGRFGDATIDATAALAVVNGPQTDEIRAVITEHLDRYRHGQTVTLSR
jgi:spermidine synthase